MSLKFTHKPNYFFFAQTFAHFLVTTVKHNSDSKQVFELRDIYQLFRKDLAATTSSLDAILSIVDNYYVKNDHVENRLVNHYKVDTDAHTLHINFNPEVITAIQNGAELHAPSAQNYD